MTDRPRGYLFMDERPTLRCISSFDQICDRFYPVPFKNCEKNLMSPRKFAAWEKSGAGSDKRSLPS